MKQIPDPQPVLSVGETIDRECVYKYCPIYPKDKLKKGKSMVESCTFYIGYGYCDHPCFGRITKRSNKNVMA